MTAPPSSLPPAAAACRARRRRPAARLALALALAAVGCAAGGDARPAPAGADAGLPLDTLELPPGFSIALYAAAVPGARSLTRSPSGIVYVGTRGDTVHALVDGDGDGRAERVVRIASGLDQPNGVAWHDGDLYVAEVSRILRFRDIDRHLDDPPRPEVVRDDYPSDHHHGWKFIAFGPDGWLYVPVGAPCNVCEPGGIYAGLTRLRPDGSQREVFARGIRNTVGFDWQPGTGVLWFTDNGRDRLGDDLPPDELNRAPRAGLDFGFPYCHGGDVPDPRFGDGHPCADFTPPAARLGAHVASLGMRFYTGGMFPAEYRGDVLIAEHGSWNRSAKVGYRVVRARVEGDRVTAVEPFVHGWLRGQEAWGRPVDVLVLADGSLLISDDRADAVYRVTWREPR